MKNLQWILAALMGILLFGCHTAKTVTYDIPMDYPDELRQKAISLFTKGRVLYKENCSGCHGIFTKGRDNIPNFSQTQIDNYSARFLKGDPVSHAVARKMSAEQLDQVVAFLRFRKITGPATVKMGDHNN